jgi:4-nitrophenyl phosphatase
MRKSLSAIRNLLIDMDGVMYRGQMALAGAGDLIAFLEERGIRYLLVTNNATSSQAQFAGKLEGMDIHVPPDLIMTSSVATASYLATIAPAGTRVNVVGEQAMAAEFEKRGFVIGGRESPYVVCGLDRTVTYEKLKTACLAIRAGATFIGTNADKTLPVEDGQVPGAGAILAALVACTGVEPQVIGKPEPIIIRQALDLIGAQAEETACLGDRLETDILGGYRAGTATILVLTGVSTAEEAAMYAVQPDFIFADLPAMLQAWEQALAG